MALHAAGKLEMFFSFSSCNWLRGASSPQPLSNAIAIIIVYESVEKAMLCFQIVLCIVSVHKCFLKYKHNVFTFV